MDAAAKARLSALVTCGAAAEILAALATDGEDARIVGGAVRNALIGARATDIDIATTRLPQDVMALAGKHGWRAIPTGFEHGTVTLIVAGDSIEVTTLREDIATDGRHAEVRFGRDFVADAARRDFTINAMSIGRDGIVQDYFGGLADLSQRRVRFIGDADQRLREDYLRALRFLRFSAEYGEGPLDPQGLAAVDRNRHGFNRLSGERIRQELLKLLIAPRALVVIEEAEALGLLSDVTGEPVTPSRFAATTSLAAGESIARLYALAVRSRESVERLRERLKLSNAETALLEDFRRGEEMIAGGASPRHLAYRVPEALAGLAVLHPEVFGETTADIAETLQALRAAPPQFALSGADLLARGFAPGPRIGRVLAEAERRWIAAGLPEDAGEQHRLLDAAMLALDGQPPQPGTR